MRMRKSEKKVANERRKIFTLVQKNFDAVVSTFFFLSFFCQVFFSFFFLSGRVPVEIMGGAGIFRIEIEGTFGKENTIFFIFVPKSFKAWKLG